LQKAPLRNTPINPNLAITFFTADFVLRLICKQESRCGKAFGNISHGDRIAFTLFHFGAGKDHHGIGKLGAVGYQHLITVLYGDLRPLRLKSHVQANDPLRGIGEGLRHSRGTRSDKGAARDRRAYVIVQSCGIAYSRSADRDASATHGKGTVGIDAIARCIDANTSRTDRYASAARSLLTLASHEPIATHRSAKAAVVVSARGIESVIIGTQVDSAARDPNVEPLKPLIAFGDGDISAGDGECSVCVDGIVSAFYAEASAADGYICV